MPVPGYDGFFGAYLFSGTRRAIVDIGPTATVPGLLESLAALGIDRDEVDYVVLTHIHIDHAGGTGTALRALSNARAVVHPAGRRHLADPAQLQEASIRTSGTQVLNYGPIEPVPEDRMLSAEDGMRLDLGTGVVLELVLTPGHAQHHLSVFERGDGILLAGDAAGVCFNGALRSASPPPFHFEKAMASLDRLLALHPKRLCYAHLGCYDGAPQRLEAMKRKLVYWREVARRGAAAGRDPEATLSVLMREDPDLAYLDGLGPFEYEREYGFLITDVRGLADAR